METSENKQKSLESRIKVAVNQIDKFRTKRDILKKQLKQLNPRHDLAKTFSSVPTNKCFKLGNDVFFKVMKLSKVPKGSIWVDYIEINLDRNWIVRKSVNHDYLKLKLDQYVSINIESYNEAFGELMRRIHDAS